MPPPDPFLYFGVGRTASPSAPLSLNGDVRVLPFASDVIPQLQEKKKVRLRGILRNHGNHIADFCYIEAWWSPANITGTSLQRCTAVPLFGGTTPIPTKTQPFTVNPMQYRETADMLWDVPDLASLGVGAQGTFKIILKAYYPGVNGYPPVAPNPALSPECDPCCAVRTITIVGV